MAMSCTCVVPILGSLLVVGAKYTYKGLKTGVEILQGISKGANRIDDFSDFSRAISKIGDGASDAIKLFDDTSDIARTIDTGVDAIDVIEHGSDGIKVASGSSVAVTKRGVSTISYERPSKFRKGVKRQTWQQAVDASEDGIVRSPGGKVINEADDWQMGHKPGYEFRKHKESAEKRGISRKDFLDEHNDPNHYRPELSEDNLGHKFEGSDDLNFWDD
jgi:hypothetical protein